MKSVLHTKIKECIPKGKLKKMEENWIPEIG